MYPKPVPARGTQSYRKPCRFQRDAYEQKTHIDYKNRVQNASQRKLRESSHPLPPKKKNERTPRATNRTDRSKPRRHRPDGLPQSISFAFVGTVRLRRDMIENRRTLHKNTYWYTSSYRIQGGLRRGGLTPALAPRMPVMAKNISKSRP